MARYRRTWDHPHPDPAPVDERNPPPAPPRIPQGLPRSLEHKALAAQIRRDELIADAVEKLCDLLDRAIIALDQLEDEKEEPNEPTADGPTPQNDEPEMEVVRVRDLAVGDIVSYDSRDWTVLDPHNRDDRVVLGRGVERLAVGLGPQDLIQRLRHLPEPDRRPDWESVKVSDLARGDVVEWFGNVAAVIALGPAAGYVVLRRGGSTWPVTLLPDTSIRRRIRRHAA